MIYTISKFFFFVAGKLFFRMKVTGAENIPKKGGFILASNHISYLDPGAVGTSCPRKLSYMAKEELFSKNMFASWLRAVGGFPVKRKTADLSAVKEAMRRVKAGGGLLLFPEGARRSEGDNTDSPLEGVGFLATKLNVPVIPACIKGSDKALPKGAKFFRTEKISVCFGKQISIDQKMPYQDAALLIMEKIRQLQKFS